jgi:choline kinase
MVFIKKVISGSKTYYYLVRSYRTKTSVQQEIIKPLTPEEANDPHFISNYLKENPGYQESGIKAIILAAGKSLRLYPYSQDLPKSLIPIGTKPILRYSIDALKQSGINDILVVTGFQDQKLRESFKNEVRYFFNPFFSVSNILASLWSVSQDIESLTLILYGDILFDPKIINLLIEDPADISLAITSSPLDTGAEKVIIQEDYVQEISKDIITKSSSVFEFAGIIKLNQIGSEAFYETLDELAREEGFLDMQLPALIQRLILKGYEISTQRIPANLWIDIDFPKDIQRAEREFLPFVRSHVSKKQ